MGETKYIPFFARGGATTTDLLIVLGIAALIGIGAFIWKWKDNIRFLKIAVRGDRVVGWIVQANDMLYQKAGKDGENDQFPGLVVFSLDPKDGYNVEFMESICKYLIKLKENGTDDPKLKKLVQEIRDEKWRKNRIRQLPEEITDGAEVYMAHVLICVPNLPKKRITRSYIRVKVMADDVESGVDHCDYHPDDRAEPAPPPW
jgi:hypothetical protein